MRRPIAAGVIVALVLLCSMPAQAAGPGEDDAARLQAGAALLLGRELYEDRCISCHGPRGHGGSAASVDFADPAALIRLDTATISEALTKVHSSQFFSILSEAETTAVSAYIREHLMLPAPAIDASTGRSLYAQTCSVCHGDRGDSASWAKNSLNPAPADFTAHGRNQLSRAKMIETVTFGSPGTAMVSFATQLNREEISATIDYIRETFMTEKANAESSHMAGHDHGGDDHGGEVAAYPGGVEGDPHWGEAFFRDNCAECHGAKGDGEGPRAHFMIRKPMDLTSALAKSRFTRPVLFQAIAKGVRGAPMPAWDTVLSEIEIANVAEYVYRSLLHPDESTADDAAAPIWRKQDDSEHHGPKKKILSCGPIERADLTRGRAVYNARCYFCHGYSGDGRTVSGLMLDPPPRDFTSAEGLDAAKIVEAVTLGRAGTAMQPFASILSQDDIDDVATFVAERFVGCQDPNTTYHTVANGWPDHESRYAAAIPFIDGTAPIDDPAGDLSKVLQAGSELFLSTCVSCHEGTVSVAQPLGLHAPVETIEEHSSEHVDDYEVKTIHDYPPELTDLTAEETKGGELYAAACAQCHAADGTGLNWVGKFLRPPPPDFTTAEFARAFHPSDFAARTLSPRPDISMPAFARVLDNTAAAAITAYVRRAFVVGNE